MVERERRTLADPGTREAVVSVAVHVRPRSGVTKVGGMHDGALTVRVADPAHGGRANSAMLQAVADALGIPRRSVTLLHGATARRKVIHIRVPSQMVMTVQRQLARLRGG